METETNKQPKQERSRTRWTASLDKIFADLVVEQIQLGNRANNIFDKKTWNTIREDFNRQTDLNFNNNQLRKHLDVLRTRFNNLRSANNQNTDLVMDDSCCIGFDMWDDIGSHSRTETTKTKDCPIYDQLCAIFSDSSADGKYAQSSHYEGPDKSVGGETPGLTSHPGVETPHRENTPALQPVQGNSPSGKKTTKNIAERKRRRPSETQLSPSQSKKDQEIIDAMAHAMSEMIGAANLRTVANPISNDRCTITNCIKALDEIKGISEKLYFAALDLFEDS